MFGVKKEKEGFTGRFNPKNRQTHKELRSLLELLFRNSIKNKPKK